MMFRINDALFSQHLRVFIYVLNAASVTGMTVNACHSQNVQYKMCLHIYLPIICSLVSINFFNLLKFSMFFTSHDRESVSQLSKVMLGRELDGHELSYKSSAFYSD